jgi:PIN domain nuclease of toxin-antitoxin system
MIAGVADTHAALWLLFGDSRLSASAKKFFDQTADEGREIALSPISLAEVVYLVEKKRLPDTAFENLVEAIKDPEHIFEEQPFTREIAAVMRQVPRDVVPDMPDRVLAATAVYLDVPLISRDHRIRASTVKTLW